MKRIIPAILCLVALAAGFFLGRYTRQSPLEEVLEAYTGIIQGEMPEDVRLTIYVMDLQTFYSIPTSRERLLTRPHEKITVGPEELAPYWQSFRTITPSALQLASEKEDFREHGLGYVLEVGDGQGSYERILEVYQVGNNATVNRLEVEGEEFLIDLVLPFFTEKARYLRCLDG